MVQRFKPVDAHQDRRPKACQDGRNESMKIMKKSASIKLCDVGDIKGTDQLMKVLKKPKAIDLSDVNGLISLPDNALPNYMKPTSSSGAKKDIKQASFSNGVKSTTCDKNQARRNSKTPKPEPSGRCLVKTSSLKLARNLTKSSSFKQTISVKKNMSDTHVQKGTCSSLLKDYKFPSKVMLKAGASESNGASSMEICTYKYCSLNGHQHAIAQPLKSFISDKRRSLKKQKNLKKLREDATREVLFYEESKTKEGVEFFVDIYENVDIEKNLVAAGMEAESDEELYESIWEIYEKEIQEFEYIEAQLEEEVYLKIENEAEFDCISKSSFKGSVTESEDVAKSFFEDEFAGCFEEDHESKGDDNLEHQAREEIDETFSYTEDLVEKYMVSAEDENIAVCAEEEENSEDDQMKNKCEMDQESIEFDQNDCSFTDANGESEAGISDKRNAKCKAVEDSDSEKGFNPQEPNYLPLEPEPKSEQVDLKHQDIDERKNSEEWMVDFALRKTVNKLAPVKRKKVELLVEAFESVVPDTTSENPARRGSYPMENMKTIQACN